LADVVRVIREFRPDVLVTLPPESPGGGQHHQATSRLALEAFRAAAEPQRFPEHLEKGLTPFQPRKIYATGTGGGSEGLEAPLLRLSTAQFDPLLGGTWAEMGFAARTEHRSQGAGVGPVPASGAEAVLSLLDSLPAVTGRETDLTDGIGIRLLDLVRFVPPGADADALRSGLVGLEAHIEAARTSFDVREPSRTIAALGRAASEVDALLEGLGSLPRVAQVELALRLGDTRRDLHLALALAHGLSITASVDDKEVVRGQTVGVTMTAVHHGPEPLEIVSLLPTVPDGWIVRGPAAAPPRRLVAGETLTATYTVDVARHAALTTPSWRRAEGREGPAPPTDDGLPWSPPPLLAALTWRSAGATVTTQAPVSPFDVVPAVTLEVQPDVLIEPLLRPRMLEVRVAVRNHAPGPAEAAVKLELPLGFALDPPVHAIHFTGADEERRVRFVVRPSRPLVATRFPVNALAVIGDEIADSALDAVDYPHISRKIRLRPARALLLALEVRTRPSSRVAWVRGTGDVAAEAVAALGIPCDPLGPDDLAFADLSRYTTILIGVRAYEVRSDLRLAHGRLLDWVRAGGHLVVQYQREAWNAGRAESPWAPYAAAVTPRRLSDERTPLEPLVPAHVLLQRPNAIGPEDFEGWVQERGIQFLDARDSRYVDLLAGEDPFSKNPGRKTGMLVVAPLGKGTWTYVGLGLFRQLPAGVPGAWRLLANLVSRPGPARTSTPPR
jgi:hypothetical protein